MMNKKLLIAVGLVAFSSSICAGPFKINVDSYGDEDGVTEAINQLGMTGTLATSIYKASSFNNIFGSTVIDTNIYTEVTALAGEPIAGVHTALDGTILNGSVGDKNSRFVNPVVYTQASLIRNIDQLNLVDGSGEDFEGFSGNNSKDWFLDFQYYFTGTVSTSSQVFNDGYFNIFFIDKTSGNRVQVARLDVDNSELSNANLQVSGGYTGDFDGDGVADNLTDFQKNFFFDIKTGKTFWELWSESALNTNVVAWAINTNVVPPIPSASQLVLFNKGTADQSDDVLIRQTDLNSSIGFAIPEPSSVALLGMGLLGLGARFGKKHRRTTNPVQ
ncbi:PEP-CTERM sorting domain-containing protein [Chromatium okenii]|jgi:hypothetical protein|uniref:PEP-CTERM sorting domain-containing protein n=1 Tax=Chromatium okenii TaxID=61644 RepID=UPI0026ED7E81|nr:PEP-CTERM sorting domain-containing protein [Chromatium okenii]MBV5311503.1 PEP-CTERM sorting domain-containing protein [Chromatium okenii]